ncbi:squalene--hopene cyclase [soil metagenome]
MPKPKSPETHNYWDDWKLETKHGRQVWCFSPVVTVDKAFIKSMGQAFRFDKNQNANSADRVYRVHAVERNFTVWEEKSINSASLPEVASMVAAKGVNFFKALQAEEGHWPGDYGGPMFLLPGLIVASYITSTPLPETHVELIKRYMLNHQNADGGWGLHIEGTSTMFGTVMQYAALRLLGVEAEATQAEKARTWILSHGGATHIPPWGKFYLALLGVYDWKGCDSLLPEMWLLPEKLPVHPSRYWCHTRMVYLPMSYCYGHKITVAPTPVMLALRKELYKEEYTHINWRKARRLVSKTDTYTSTSTTYHLLYRFVINPYERSYNKTLRKKALRFALDYVDAEDEQTNFVDIGPVNQVINSIVVHHAYGKDSPQFKKHVERWFDYLWLAEDGMKMNGYNGSQLWDTAFAMQAILEGELEQQFPETIQRAYHYLDTAQVTEDVPKRTEFFRHISKGGWPFSTLEHGWPISDCTAEAVSAILKAQHSSLFQRNKALTTITNERLFDAINIILSFQNKDGGWATYENTRSQPWIEVLNPSAIFGNIMIDYSYTECTSACIRALSEFKETYPAHRATEITKAIAQGIRFVTNQQLQDGSWFGSWAVCFTYGTWFGLEALIADGKATYTSGPYAISERIQKACDFLISKQNKDGGWGESFKSCAEHRYIPHAQSQIVNTSWALLALMAAKYPDKVKVEQGIRFLISKQQENGDWAQESISGVFNNSCMISYTNYRNIFPIWALGRYKKYANK